MLGVAVGTQRTVYENRGLRVVAHLDGELEARWRSEEAPLRNSSDTSKNRHATKHFRATRHPIIMSYEPAEEWGWCFVDQGYFESLPEVMEQMGKPVQPVR